MPNDEWLVGALEGFYGRPWSHKQRLVLFDRMHNWKMNAYMYAPKDDDKHRRSWRSLYTNEELNALRQLITQCNNLGIRFIYALAPGLDICFTCSGDIAALQAKITQLISLECYSFAILWDDIPPKLNEEDAKIYKSPADAHCKITNQVHTFVLRECTKLGITAQPRIAFCPTPYCGAMAIGGKNYGDDKIASTIYENSYLNTVGEKLHPDILCFWTGPAVISETITGDHLREVGEVIKRKPLIWDNLHANDYDLRRVYLGPYYGREAEGLMKYSAGVLSNPNNEFECNFVPLRTLSLLAIQSENYDPMKSLEQAASEWVQVFNQTNDTIGIKTEFKVEDAILLCDLFFLPYNHGPQATKWIKDCEQISIHGIFSERNRGIKEETIKMCKKVKQLFQSICDMNNRDLMYEVHSYVWELNGEADVQEGLFQHVGPEPYKSVYIKPEAFRGGVAASLQKYISFSQSSGLFSCQIPNNTFTIRPYSSKDEDGAFSVCLLTGNEGEDGTHLFPEDPKIIGRRWVGPYLTGKDISFVCEDDFSICGYVLAALDSNEFYARYKSEYIPNMIKLYPNKPDKQSKKLTKVEEYVLDFHEQNCFVNETVFAEYPSHLHIDLIPRAQGRGLGQKMMNVLLDSLKSKGSIGVHLQMSPHNIKAFKFYSKMGFVPVIKTEDDLIMGLKF